MELVSGEVLVSQRVDSLIGAPRHTYSRSWEAKS